MASEVSSPAAAASAGVGLADDLGTTNSGVSEFSKAMMGGKGFAGRGAFARVGGGAGGGAVAGFAFGFSFGFVFSFAFAFVFGLAFELAFGFAFGAESFLSAGALRFMTVRPCFARAGSGGPDEMTPGFAGADRSANAWGNGRSSGVTDGATLATGGGRSTTRRSGTATRRSSQGKAKPGSPGSSPPRVRLNSKAWASRESNSARPSRLQSWLVRLPPPHTGPREMASRIPAAPASVTSPAAEPVQAG